MTTKYFQENFPEMAEIINALEHLEHEQSTSEKRHVLSCSMLCLDYAMERMKLKIRELQDENE